MGQEGIAGSPILDKNTASFSKESRYGLMLIFAMSGKVMIMIGVVAKYSHPVEDHLQSKAILSRICL